MQNGEPAVKLPEGGLPGPLASHSRFVQRLRRRYIDQLPLLPEGPPGRDAMGQTFAALQSAGHDVATALRMLRQIVMERLVVLDCERNAPLSDITSAVT